MSTTFHYDVGVVLDNLGVPLTGKTCLFRLAGPNGPTDPVGVVDAAGNAATIVTSDFGAFSRFNYVNASTDPDDLTGAWGYLDCNGVMQPIVSVEVLNALPEARSLLAAAQDAQAAAAAAQQAAEAAETGFRIVGSRLVTDPVLTYDQAVALYGNAPGTFYAVDQT